MKYLMNEKIMLELSYRQILVDEFYEGGGREGGGGDSFMKEFTQKNRPMIEC